MSVSVWQLHFALNKRLHRQAAHLLCSLRTLGISRFRTIRRASSRDEASGANFSQKNSYAIPNYCSDNNFVTCNALSELWNNGRRANFALRQKFRRAFNIRPTLFMDHEIFPRYNCAFKPEFIMPILLRRSIPASPFVPCGHLKRKICKGH